MFQFVTLIYLFTSAPSARHGDGLYDSYMRTDHILKDEADVNSPSGLPPMPKHTVSKRNTQPVFHVLRLRLGTSFSSERYPQVNPVSLHTRSPPPSLILSALIRKLISTVSHLHENTEITCAILIDFLRASENYCFIRQHSGCSLDKVKLTWVGLKRLHHRGREHAALHNSWHPVWHPLVLYTAGLVIIICCRLV